MFSLFGVTIVVYFIKIGQLMRFIGKHKLGSFTIAVSILSAIGGIISYFEVTVKIKKGISKIKDMAHAVTNLGKNVKEMLNNMGSYMNLPAQSVYLFSMLVGLILHVIHYFTRIAYYRGASLVVGIFGIATGIMVNIYDIFENFVMDAGEGIKDIGDKMQKPGIIDYYRVFPKFTSKVIQKTVQGSGKVISFVGDEISEKFKYITNLLLLGLIILIIKWGKEL